jgi:hypothetical protein
MTRVGIVDWIAGSNAIEGIHRPPTAIEIQEHELLLRKPQLIVQDLVRFVRYVAPGAELRDRPGMNVRVGTHIPVPGGAHIEPALADVLAAALDCASPYQTHVDYETLHPFMDGNGRSGRALWAWQMNYIGEDPFALSFLHRFYYQTLEASR